MTPRFRLWLYVFAAFVAWSLACVLVGRFSAPSKVETITKTVHDTVTIAGTSETHSDATTKTVDTSVVETKHPDGTVTTEHRNIVGDGTIRIVHSTHVEYQDRIVYKDREKRVERAAPDWLASLQVGASNHRPTLQPSTGNPLVDAVPIVARVSLERRIVGPFSCGAWLDNSIAAGLGCSVAW